MHEANRNKSLKNRHSFKLTMLIILLVLLSVAFLIIRLKVFWGGLFP